MGAPQPGLEVSKDPMDTREDLRRPLWGTVGFRAVTVAHALQRDVASPPIGQDDCSALDIRRNEARERGRGGAENHVEPDSARPLPPPRARARPRSGRADRPGVSVVPAYAASNQRVSGMRVRGSPVPAVTEVS